MRRRIAEFWRVKSKTGCRTFWWQSKEAKEILKIWKKNTFTRLLGENSKQIFSIQGVLLVRTLLLVSQQSLYDFLEVDKYTKNSNDPFHCIHSEIWKWSYMIFKKKGWVNLFLFLLVQAHINLITKQTLEVCMYVFMYSGYLNMFSIDALDGGVEAPFINILRLKKIKSLIFSS